MPDWYLTEFMRSGAVDVIYREEINGECEACGNPTVDGDPYESCSYSPEECKTCGEVMGNIIRNKQFTDEQIKNIEKHYKDSKYVCDTSLKTSGGNWGESCVSVFYQKEKHPKFGNNYFGLYYTPDGTLMICNADQIEDQTIVGIKCDNGDIIYSRYRHDYFTHRGEMIDGGRDYTRSSGGEQVELRVKDGVLEEQDA